MHNMKVNQTAPQKELSQQILSILTCDEALPVEKLLLYRSRIFLGYVSSHHFWDIKDEEKDLICRTELLFFRSLEFMVNDKIKREQTAKE